jgi:hypothetical protein
MMENVESRCPALPPHLELGITLSGIVAWLASAREDAVAYANSTRDAAKHPAATFFNGYVNQVLLRDFGQGRAPALPGGVTAAAPESTWGAYCEKLHRIGSLHVGPATRFVCWPLSMPLPTLSML